VTASPGADGEPGLTHMRGALQRRIPVVTSNKWPVALHGAELLSTGQSTHLQAALDWWTARLHAASGAAR
jgi:homoserine dehydrogenase